MIRDPARRSSLRWLPCALLLELLVAPSSARTNPMEREVTTPSGVLQRAVEINRLSMQLTNCGWFASDLVGGCCPSNGGLEFPRGSGKILAFAGGLWMSGHASDSLRTAIAEYDTEFVPGPGMPGGPGLDTLRHRVYSVSGGDTTGWGEWMARAVPLGAPVDSAGTHPGLIGDQTLWTVYTDAGVTSRLYGRGPRKPIGLEVQITAYAFDRAPILQDVIFLHYRLIHRGSEMLDSTYVGLWYDADVRTAATPAGSDSSLDLGYVYRTTNDVLYGIAGPATGVTLLRGPRDGGTGLALRASSIVGYANGTDPNSPTQYDFALRGLYPWGAPMIDSTTSLPTRFYAWGDPVTGNGWLMPNVHHPKIVLGAGPFRFAPGDTQVVDAAIVVGQGMDRPSSVVAMRNNAREARAAFNSGFTSVPGPREVAFEPLVARPIPSHSTVSFDVLVPAGGAQVELDILDVSGRRVRRVEDGWQAGGVSHLSWDGADDGGRSAPAGVFFARSRVAGKITRARIVLIR